MKFAIVVILLLSVSVVNGDDHLQKLLASADRNVDPATSTSLPAPMLWINKQIFIAAGTWHSYDLPLSAQAVIGHAYTGNDNATVTLQEAVYVVTTAFIQNAPDCGYSHWNDAYVAGFYSYLTRSNTGYRLRFLCHIKEAITLFRTQFSSLLPLPTGDNNAYCHTLPAINDIFNLLNEPSILDPNYLPSLEVQYDYYGLYRLWDVINAHCLYRPPNFCQSLGNHHFQAAYYSLASLSNYQGDQNYFNLVAFFEFFLAIQGDDNPDGSSVPGECACGINQHWPCTSSLYHVNTVYGDTKSTWMKVDPSSSSSPQYFHKIPNNSTIDFNALLFSGENISKDQLTSIASRLQNNAWFSNEPVAVYHLMKHWPEIPTQVKSALCSSGDESTNSAKCYIKIASTIIQSHETQIGTNLDQFGARVVQFHLVYSSYGISSSSGLVVIRLTPNHGTEFYSSMETYIPDMKV